jgi:adenylate cyclase, class 2
MAQEIEIKLKVSDVKALKRTLKRLNARLVDRGTGCVHEWNVIFDTPGGALAKRGQLLRIRTESPQTKSQKAHKRRIHRTLLTFKRPLGIGDPASSNAEENHRHKVREELELEVADAANLTKIFEGLGMRGWFRYEKYRTTYRLPVNIKWAKGLLIELDETPIGTFVELEGPPSAIDRAAKALGFSAHGYILKNYLALYIEDCQSRGEEPHDMVFAPTK